ncbi:MAG: DUF4340 domain-containing protein [Pseudomonadota bacterium]|nr:DUF4340 domain-containing protein [Pseudomonadota bacterium]MDO7667169.1 DUF4340 domain-containing protein [Pseudomonadota bacterium]MDO7711812.1 DUF4340 domain-containing protein [Pseudomonadota bacterium]
MKKSYLRNLILIGLIIGLYWFNTFDYSAENEMPQLSSLNSNNIHYITISRPNIVDIVLAKSASGWQITQPIKAIANNKRVELLLSFLNTPSYAQITIGDGKSLSQYELEPANLVLTLDQHRVQFGGVEPISKHRYVLIDNVIHLITDRITPLLRANATSFIENKLFPKTNIITKLIVSKSNTDNSLSAESIIIENNNGHWQSNSPTITTDRLSAFIQNWQHAYALQVLPLQENGRVSTATHKLQIWFNDQALPTKYELKLSDNALFVVDHQLQLSYQFTLESLAQLLPFQTIE